MTSIHDRPTSVEERREAGHWEGDLVMGRRPSAVATLVERSTRMVRVVALPNGYKADTVRDALINNLADVPPNLRRSLTWDRGREMACHDQIAHALGMQVFFCDARSPWQRGTNENTNRLLRQYLAKNADLRSFTQADLNTIAARIDARAQQIIHDNAGEPWLQQAQQEHPGALREILQWRAISQQTEAPTALGLPPDPNEHRLTDLWKRLQAILTHEGQRQTQEMPRPEPALNLLLDLDITFDTPPPPADWDDDMPDPTPEKPQHPGTSAGPDK